MRIPGAEQVTACAFGGPKLDVLFVTTASCGIAQGVIDKKQPNAGAVFSIDLSKHGVRGVPAPRFKLDAAAATKGKKRARGA